MGLICSTLNTAGEASRLAANSISTSHFISSRAMSSRRVIIFASGNMPYFSTDAKVINFGPSGKVESTMRIFSRSHVLPTFANEANFGQSASGMRSRFTASSTEVLNESGFRLRAKMLFCVSETVFSGVDV